MSSTRINPETGLPEILPDTRQPTGVYDLRGLGGFLDRGLLDRGTIDQGDDIRSVPSTDQSTDWSKPQYSMAGPLPKGYYSGPADGVYKYGEGPYAERTQEFLDSSPDYLAGPASGSREEFDMLKAENPNDPRYAGGYEEPQASPLPTMEEINFAGNNPNDPRSFNYSEQAKSIENLQRGIGGGYPTGMGLFGGLPQIPQSQPQGIMSSLQPQSNSPFGSGGMPAQGYRMPLPSYQPYQSPYQQAMPYPQQYGGYGMMQSQGGYGTYQGIPNPYQPQNLF